MPTPMDLALGSLEEDIVPIQDQMNPTNLWTSHDNNKINKFEWFKYLKVKTEQWILHMFRTCNSLNFDFEN
jgi:hypothetical protein